MNSLVEASGSQLLHSLNAVVNFLHTEGFYAAEETLLREIENRYPAPDAVSLCQVSTSPGSSGSAGGAVGAEQPHLDPAASKPPSGPGGTGASSRGPSGVDTVDFQPALAAAAAAAHSPLVPVDSMDSAEKVLEAWRSKSTTPAASPKKAAGLSPPASPASAPKSWPTSIGFPGGGDNGGSSEADEYEDDDDPGFLRLDVVGQEAALGLELDHLSDASGVQEGAYYQQLEDHELDAVAAAHARHSSIDMGQLNRQLHGTAGTCSASSSQHGRSKQQQTQQVQQQQQGVLLNKPVTSSEHWRVGDQPLLPLGVPGLLAALDGTISQQQQQQQAAADLAVEAGAEVQQLGSPCASSGGGGSSFFSGELACSPVKQPLAGISVPAVHKRSSSYAQRQAGTAQWVFDRANSADAAAYRSLLHHLDRPSAGGQPQQDATAQQCEPIADHRRWRQPALLQPSAALALKQASVEQQGAVANGGEGVGAEAGSPLFHQESISRVSSLGESMLQEAVALCLSDTQLQQEEHEVAAAAAQQQEQFGAAGASAEQASAEPGGPQLRLHQLPPLPPQIQQRQQQGDEPAELVLGQSQQLVPPLPMLRMSGTHRGSNDGQESGIPHHRSPSTVADTTAALRGSECECSSPLGSSAHTPDGASIIDYSDPFSFPVTPPSEVAQPPDPAPLFGSWASFKSSPDRKSGGLGGYVTEDESTPARRRYQQQEAVAAAAAAAAAKEADCGGVQRSIKFPPLGAGALGGGGLLRGYGSSSQLLSYGTSARMLADEELGTASELDQEYFEGKYEVLSLKVVHRRHCTGFEQARELPLHIDDLIAGRYQIVDLLGQAAFSRAVQALDLKSGALVCLKIIKNNKDYFDQGLDEVKLLQYVNAADPHDESGLLRLHDFFYFKEHLVLVTELLRANLYEFQKFNRESGDDPYFTLPRIQSIARQVLTSLAFLHSLGLVHADLKPENILVKSYSRCQVKVIDLGSSCFLTDHLSSYVQSRSYRAPEVILGLPYDQKVDVWSLGCILAELATGKVLFQNESIATLLARLEGILGPLPRWMLHRGRYAHKYYLRDGRIFNKNQRSARYEFLRPKVTTLARRVPQADEGMLSFLKHLLQQEERCYGTWCFTKVQADPAKRPSAREALQHHWLQQDYY